LKDTNFEGRCPFSVSDNLKIKASSYDLHFDGVITRYGSISGFRATDLEVPFHVFLMNVSNRNVTWDIQVEGKTEEIIMGTDHFINNYTKDRSKNLLQHIQGLTDEEVVNAVSYIKRIMPDDLKRDALIDDFYPLFIGSSHAPKTI